MLKCPEISATWTVSNSIYFKHTEFVFALLTVKIYKSKYSILSWKGGNREGEDNAAGILF